MISKELLIAAGGCNPNVEFYLDDNYIVIGYDGENHYDINIYELSHKCKEWARDKGYLLYSLPDLCIVKTLSLEYCVDFGLNTEIESIFRACQWILDNKSIP